MFPLVHGKFPGIPDILGGVAVAYNLPGVSTRIKLDGPTLAGIFDGSITKFDNLPADADGPGPVFE